MADVFSPKNRITAFHAKELQETAADSIPRKPPNTEQALNGLEDIASRLDALVSEMERRVSPVLLPSGPDTSTAKDRAQTSPLADKMFNEESRLRSIAERLDSIVSRIDL